MVFFDKVGMASLGSEGGLVQSSGNVIHSDTERSGDSIARRPLGVLFCTVGRLGDVYFHTRL